MTQRDRVVTIACGVLSLFNFFVGGLLGFLFAKGPDRGIFLVVFLVCAVVSIVGVVCDWFALRQAASEVEYKVLKLRKGRLVHETRRMERDIDSLRALGMGVSGWLSSFLIVLFAFAMVWPDTFWMLSFRMIICLLSLFAAGVELGVEIVILKRKRKKGVIE